MLLASCYKLQPGGPPLKARFSALCKNFAFYFRAPGSLSFLSSAAALSGVILSQVLVCSGRLNNDRNDKNDKPARKKNQLVFPGLYSGQGARFVGLNRGRNTSFGVGIPTLLLSEPPRFLSRAAPGLIRSMSLANMATPTARRKVDE